ncbi:hypothetical protein F5Y19DRAFT_56936 [Xylariaceae sp. FL1651]|nr:hypothetical protein F5Y19DRAFT_56936 [Xylariaceae sp. FL1651]
MSLFSCASPTARVALSRACKSTRTTQISTTKRTFSSLPHLRPSILPSNGTVFRPSNSSNTLQSRVPTTTSSPMGITSAPEGVLDIVPKSAITTHPALAGPQQIRCGPRPTMARSSRLIRKRRHGFLSRVKTRNGQKTLQRRKEKKRSVMSM